LPPKKEPRRARDRGGVNPTGDPLFDALRDLRRSLAQEAGVPPYVIFHDSTLREMAAMRPPSLAALGEIGGVGIRKLEAYGDAFLEAIRQFGPAGRTNDCGDAP
jgi:ATP-dependent DNA helicase RecQ